MLKFQYDHKPMCLFCRHAQKLPYSEDLLCKKHGAVSPEHSCKKFSYNLIARKARRKKEIDTSKYTAEDFSLE